MLTLGLTGGVASGKSLAAKYFAELGAAVFDADRAGHEVLREPQVRDVLIERWGPAILDSSGEIDRSAVAKKVFGNPPTSFRELSFLEALVHPRIRSRLEKERASMAGNRVLVVDAALLLESGWNSACDLVVFVDAPRELRLARAESRGWTEQQFSQREAVQWPVEKKRRASDHVLSNDGTREELRSRVRDYWRERVEPVVSAEMP